MPWSNGFPGVLDGAHGSRAGGGQHAVPVQLTIAEVQPEESGGVEDVTDESTVGGPVHVEPVQCEVVAVPGPHDAGRQDAT